MLDGSVSDAVEAASLSFNLNHIAVYSSSWGPDDNGEIFEGPGLLVTKALLNGIQKVSITFRKTHSNRDYVILKFLFFVVRIGSQWKRFNIYLGFRQWWDER